ncbi:hypothetical protein [Carboxylicivirga caseinilyticus]|uniref:hypothetical protein n=1 Tax=Carboxylicivirga caseinilyticus TaxID=3417572 RepID=UPI003D3441C5|nr:hypothetical protein [Marinilabiliaceae bacterium A049]
MALISFLTADTYDKDQLAIKVSTAMLSSGLIALFYTIWILQHYIHLYRSGYYKMLLAFGLSRHQLYIYQFIQNLIFVNQFLFVMFFASSISAITRGILPWELLASTPLTSVISYFLLLLALGQIAALLSTIRWNHMLLLPVLFYWFFESWVVYLITKHNPDWIHFLPIDSLKQIVGNQILTINQGLIIAFYLAFVFHLLYHNLQRRNLC